MNTKRFFLWSTMIALALFALFPATTFAQEDVTDSQYNERLELLYGRLQEVSQRGEERLAQAHEVVGKVNDGIADLQAQGFDTADIEAALTNFETAIGDAEAAKAAGDAILAAHEGFDDNGKVIDPQLASETLRAVKEEFSNGRQTLREAARNLRHTIRDFRRDNRGDI